jgi:hypothetical protein
MHLVIILVSHGFIFFALPIIGNYNNFNKPVCDIPTPQIDKTKTTEDDTIKCRDFSNNSALIIFYLFYVVYLFYSALQIQHGLIDVRKKSLLMRGDNIVFSSIFKAYKAIPFLYELKLTVDWTFTPTCLDLFKWLKFESVYDTLFITHCTKKAEETIPVGKPIPTFKKGLMGCSSFLILLSILLAPLVLFSTLNPSNMNNNVTGAHIELFMSFQLGKVFNNYSLFKNDHVDSISEIDKKTLHKYNYDKSPFTKSYPINEIQTIQMSNTSDTIWDIASPHIDTIKDRLRNYAKNNYFIYFTLEYSYTRDVSCYLILYNILIIVPT